MIQFLTPLLIGASLHAQNLEDVEELSSDVVQSLYIEAALFITVFTVMSIVSIVISKRHAAQNLIDDKKKREKKQSKEVSITNTKNITRIDELNKMLKDGLISKEEFQVLKDIKN